MEEVLFKSEERMTRAAVADMLRTVADRLEAGEPLTFAAGDQSVTLDVPATPTFEVKAERETGKRTSELSVEFELEWDENGEEEDASLSIE